MGDRKDTMFVLSEEGVTSSYLKIGQTFRGYKILVFDKGLEMLTVLKEDKVLQIRLNESKVVGSPPRVAMMKVIIDANGDVEIRSQRMSIDAFCEHVRASAGPKDSTQFAMFFKCRKGTDGTIGKLNEAIERVISTAKTVGFSGWVLLIDEPAFAD